MPKYFLPALFVFTFPILMLTSCQESHPDESPAIKHPEVAGRKIVKREVLKKPVPAYNFKHIDQYGKSIQLSDLRGSFVVVTFLYTSCPDVCPLLAARVAQLETKFKKAVKNKELTFVLVTVDAKLDKPARLLEYTQAFNGKWYFISDNEARLQKTWNAYGLYRKEKERNKEIVIYHSYKTHLIDKNGKTLAIHTGLWDTDVLAKDLSALLKGEKLK